MEGLLVILFFFGLLFIRVPIAIALGVSSVIYTMFFSPVPLSMLIQSFISGLDSFTLLGVPFFILAGSIMVSGGISKRLIEFSNALLGKLVGSLGIVTVFSSLIFGAISGSGPATVASIGKIMIPAMVNEKYDRGFACSLAAVSGAFGPLIPPSIVMIVYGVSAQVSITTLFMAGILPGILVAIALMIFAFVVARKNKFGAQFYTAAELAQHTGATEVVELEQKSVFVAFKRAFWGLLCPAIILGGIYSGMFTPTEAAVVACIYALIIGVFVYKEITLSNIAQIFKDTAATNGTILILVACATAFGRVLAMAHVPAAITNLITGLSENPVVILLLILSLVFVLGLFMEALSLLIIITPILLPIVGGLGIHPIHFGIIMTMGIAISQTTPPTGVNLFVAARIGECKVESIFRWLVPAVGVLVVVWLLLTFVPSISLVLPTVFDML